jgi:hypothetical protein
MASRRDTTRRVRRLVPLALLVIALVVVIALPSVSVAASPTAAAQAGPQPAQSSGLTATVTWNGASISNYSSPSAAARIDFNGVADVYYHWASPVVPATPYTINDARLQIFYFGYALATRDVVNSNAGPALQGSFTMNWSTGSLQYILEGSYRLVASLLAPNGTTMWSQSFWVFVAAPYDIAALLPIVLILIAVWEVYNLATSGRMATLGRPKQPPSTATPPEESAPPSSPPEPPPSTSEPEPATPEPEPTPPSTGGST